jgi:F-type H+-transporting ATPase subunit b
VLNEVFLTRLTKSIAQLTVENRTALFNERIDLVSACDLTDQARTKITAELAQAFDIAPDLNFVTDSDLIAGLEMQTPHFALRNSWHADLATILGDLKHDV